MRKDDHVLNHWHFNYPCFKSLKQILAEMERMDEMRYKKLQGKIVQIFFEVETFIKAIRDIKDKQIIFQLVNMIQKEFHKRIDDAVLEEKSWIKNVISSMLKEFKEEVLNAQDSRTDIRNDL